MPTLRTVLTSVSGLYVDLDSGARHLPHQLLAALSPAVLESAIRVRKVQEGHYRIALAGMRGHQFELFSRRRQPRPDAMVLSERLMAALAEWAAGRP
jgi:hypothetical protein